MFKRSSPINRSTKIEYYTFLPLEKFKCAHFISYASKLPMFRKTNHFFPTQICCSESPFFFFIIIFNDGNARWVLAFPIALLKMCPWFLFARSQLCVLDATMAPERECHVISLIQLHYRKSTEEKLKRQTLIKTYGFSILFFFCRFVAVMTCHWKKRHDIELIFPFISFYQLIPDSALKTLWDECGDI